jgi:hypothetical protein
LTLTKKATTILTLENVLKAKIICCIIFAFILLGIGLPAFGNAVSFITVRRSLAGLFNWWIFKDYSKEIGSVLFWAMAILLWIFINVGEIYPKMIEQDSKLLKAMLGNIKSSPLTPVKLDEDPRSAEVLQALNKKPGFNLGTAKWTSRACIFLDTIIAVTATPLTKNAEKWELFSWTGDLQHLEIANLFVLLLLVMGMSGNFYFFSHYVENLREYQKVHTSKPSND